MGSPIDRAALDELYCRYNRRQWVHPDPVEFLYAYENLRDREIVGLIASSLAYGRVAQIHRSIGLVLEKLGPSPSSFLQEVTGRSLRSAFQGFKHRFTSGEELSELLLGIQEMVARFGSLEACFAGGMHHGDPTVLPALCAFADRLAGQTKAPGSMFLPSPVKGSACKRLNLFLRWMVRSDEVDPGGWNAVPPSKLIVPLDTHMHRIARILGFTCRRQADMRTALEVTEAFRRIAPEDPTRYDFSLTRSGILGNKEIKSFLNRYAACRLPDV